MENINLKPKKAELSAIVAGLAVLSVIMLVFPASSLPLSLVLPLLSCPLMGHRKQQPFVWAGTLVAPFAAVFAGYDTWLVVALYISGMLPPALTYVLQTRKRMDPADMLLYVCASAFSIAAMLTGLQHHLGGNMVQALTDAVISAVEASEHRAALLYRLAAGGLISVPEGYGQGGLLGSLMEGVHSQQMLMSLRLTVETLILNALPSLCVQASLIAGMFTCLRIQHMNGVVVVVEISRENPAERKAHVSAPPGFRLFYLPRALRWAVLALALVSMMIRTGGDTLSWTLGTMGYAVFETLFRLEGAAIVVFMMTVHDEERAAWGGLLAAAIYLLAPGVLMIIALLEPVFHFRSKRVETPDEE